MKERIDRLREVLTKMGCEFYEFPESRISSTSDPFKIRALLSCGFRQECYAKHKIIKEMDKSNFVDQTIMPSLLGHAHAFVIPKDKVVVQLITSVEDKADACVGSIWFKHVREPCAMGMQINSDEMILEADVRQCIKTAQSYLYSWFKWNPKIKIVGKDKIVINR